MINIVCKVCNKEFPVFPSEIKSGKKFCSYSCRNKSMIGHHIGKEFQKGQHASIKTEFKKGKRSANWKGGKMRLKYLWIYLPSHRRAIKTGYVLNSILVAEKSNNRPLEDYEIVHHINGNKFDDAPENLKIMTRTEHKSFHAQKRWKDNGGFNYLN